MSHQLDRALAEPTGAVSRVWVLWLALISIGVWSGFFGPIQVLLAQQAEAIDPAHKETSLALVLFGGALVSTVLNPVWGAFSDRTVLRIGRRLPWVLGGLAGGVVAMLVLSQAQSILVMALGWALAQGALNAMLAAITATVPDQVPSRQRGAVGGWLAIAQTVGVVAGSGIADATGSIAAGYLATAAVLVVLSLPYCFDSRDIPLSPEDREPFDLGRFVRSFWVSPRQHPDFAWAWITRFLMNLGNALVILYLLYYLQERIDLTDDEAEHGVLLLTAAYGLCTVLTAVVGGIWSDRLGRRKVFVIASGLVAAAALLLLAFVTTWVGAFAGAVVLGIGFGIYTAVDFAMITQVLPSAGDRAKDLGVINIANALPQVLAPGIAAIVLGIGFGYSTLYVLAAGVSVLGSVLVVNIKSLA
ncbi:MFS transporter [Marmoricola sp. URHB0036]|uniref:MFS transporter n=1 Tax=Marmoricola sp. URHB0036 TaxID=1298863 RepID=UPI000404FDBB|nr:MFS transporter [Marmoricola sp. URHB0036]